jgi:hypothetical protein
LGWWKNSTNVPNHQPVMGLPRKIYL